MQMEYLICRIFQPLSRVELLGKDGNGGEEMKIKIALNHFGIPALFSPFLGFLQSAQQVAVLHLLGQSPARVNGSFDDEADVRR